MSSAQGLSIVEVSKRFVSSRQGDVVALDRVSIEARPAQIVSIVGPSGCGKSTLLRMIAGFDTPSAGEIRLGGQPIGPPSADRGIVFQEPQLYPWLTVLQNVCFGPRMRGIARARYLDAARGYIRSVGLDGFERNYPYQLSGGMRQRLQIARVLINEPIVLLMDEPFGALDYQTRLGMQKLLLDLAAVYRPTVFFVTHDIEEAIFISDRVYVMSARPGRILDTMEVELPRPRTYDAVVGTEKFIALKLRVLKQLEY